MEANTSDIAVFQQLIHKINILLSRLDKPTAHQQDGFAWISNEELCQLLKVTKRTTQNYRDRRLIAFSQIGSKIYYKSNEVEAFMQRYHIKSRAL